jgi:hypothetical protein
MYPNRKIVSYFGAGKLRHKLWKIEMEIMNKRKMLQIRRWIN